MSLLGQSAEVCSAFAFWQALRQLGFDAERLYVGIIEGRLLVTIKPPGVSVSMGSTAMSRDEFEEAWLELCEALPAIPEADLKANYDRWVTADRWETLVTTLAANGVEIPATRSRPN